MKRKSGCPFYSTIVLLPLVLEHGVPVLCLQDVHPVPAGQRVNEARLHVLDQGLLLFGEGRRGSFEAVLEDRERVDRAERGRYTGLVVAPLARKRGCVIWRLMLRLLLYTMYEILFVLYPG